MHIRTPKRYNRRTMRRRTFPVGRFLLSVFVMLCIALAILVYQNRALFQPIIEDRVLEIAQQMEQDVATRVAPTPAPTQDPTNSLIEAANYWDEGVIGESVRLYEGILDSVPNDEQTHYRVTVGHIAQGNFERAVNFAERTVTASPYSSDAWAIRAWALDWAGQPEDAIASALFARELDPGNARAVAYLAEAYLTVDNVGRAQEMANRAVELAPNIPEPYRARGLITQISVFDFAAALRDYRTAYDLATEQNNAALANFIAVQDIVPLMLGTQDYDGAIAMLEGVLQNNPQNSAALARIANIYRASLFDANRALEYAERCTQIAADSMECFYELGRVHSRLENTSSAADAFRRAVENGSNNPQHLWWAANSQFGIGNCDQAQRYADQGYDIALRQDAWVADYEALLDQLTTCSL